MKRRINLALQTVARYILAAGIMPYAISKLLDFQFQVSAWNYSRPLGAANGKILTWAFLGYSPWFQCLLGVAEFVPGLLLFARRTRRLGALLLFPVLLNVALMNFAMDLWRDTQIISLVLLALNVYLLVCDAPLYLAFLRSLLQPSVPVESNRWRITGNISEILIPIIGIALFGYYFYGLVTTMSAPLSDFVGERQINRAGTWSVQSMTVSGNYVPVWGGVMYFDFTNRCYFVGSKTMSGRFKADRTQHTFELTDVAPDQALGTTKGTYTVAGDQLTLTGQRNGQPVTVVLKRSQWGRI